MIRMKVADFFCGAGGFSEGFRQAGFEVVFALDNWKPAIATHGFNHSGCKHHQGDILAIAPDFIDSIVPDTEVLVGSPPCVAFSHSNKAGKADKTLGMALIQKYLQIVAWKKNKEGSVLKHWIMENVPNSAKHIKDRYTFNELGLPGGDKIALEIPKRNIFNAADFGAPQTRRRFVCGDYPEPVKTNPGESKWVWVKDVFSKLGKPAGQDKTEVKDPNYGFSIKSKYLTDHHYDTSVEDFEWKRARHAKEDHGYMGKMSFPENLERPGRTVMATQSAVSRESMILATDSPGRYRLPTIREISCLMSFPITYQFIGANESTKYKLVGNAVCVKLSKALARAMAGDSAVDDPNPHKDLDKMLSALPLNLNGRPHVKRDAPPRRLGARFSMHVPYLKTRGFRVEMDNLDSDFVSQRFVWKARLHHGGGKSAKKTVADSKIIESVFNGDRIFKSFKADLGNGFLKGMPSGSVEFQKRFCRLKATDGFGPEEYLEKVRDLVDRYYPESTDKLVENPGEAITIGRKEIPSRILAALYACQTLVERLS
jgi:DNA (cytosine-5)-methyltransferase 1